MNLLRQLLEKLKTLLVSTVETKAKCKDLEAKNKTLQSQNGELEAKVEAQADVIARLQAANDTEDEEIAAAIAEIDAMTMTEPTEPTEPTETPTEETDPVDEFLQVIVDAESTDLQPTDVPSVGTDEPTTEADISTAIDSLVSALASESDKEEEEDGSDF